MDFNHPANPRGFSEDTGPHGSRFVPGDAKALTLSLAAYLIH